MSSKVELKSISDRDLKEYLSIVLDIRLLNIKDWMVYASLGIAEKREDELYEKLEAMSIFKGYKEKEVVEEGLRRGLLKFNKVSREEARQKVLKALPTEESYTKALTMGEPYTYDFYVNLWGERFNAYDDIAKEVLSYNAFIDSVIKQLTKYGETIFEIVGRENKDEEL